jgi:hypothetical protein
MSTTDVEQRLRAAITATAREIAPGTIRPLSVTPHATRRGKSQRTGGWRLVQPRLMAPLGAAAAVAGVIAVALAVSSGPSGRTTGHPVSTAAPGSPTPTSAKRSTTTPTAGPTPTVSPSSSAPPLSGILTVSVSGLPADASLSYGGPPIQFTVTVSNGTATTYQDILLIVSLGHCTCSHYPSEMAPSGTLSELDTATGQWQSIFYDAEGTGMDYLLSAPPQFPSLTLSSGSSASYQLELAFAPLSQQGNYGAGQMSIDGTVVALPSRKVIGTSPAASVPLSVTTG